MSLNPPVKNQLVEELSTRSFWRGLTCVRQDLERPCELPQIKYRTRPGSRVRLLDSMGDC